MLFHLYNSYNSYSMREVLLLSLSTHEKAEGIVFVKVMQLLNGRGQNSSLQTETRLWATVLLFITSILHWWLIPSLSRGSAFLGSTSQQVPEDVAWLDCCVKYNSKSIVWVKCQVFKTCCQWTAEILSINYMTRALMVYILMRGGRGQRDSVKADFFYSFTKKH